MSASNPYELLDFGAGRKLERFGPYVLDRPSPAAEAAVRQLPHLWDQADARFERDGTPLGRWVCVEPIDDAWQVNFDLLHLELKLTDSGQVGVFPEQAANWRWIADEARRVGPIKVLNLFAYTGASTLAAAAAGAAVVHVDASSSAVARARRNAVTSNLKDLPIRWMIEDVLKFVRREVNRGNDYDALILDPPAYGHGPRGQSWQLDSHLDELLANCFKLCRGQERFLLLTCHSGRLGKARELLKYAAAQKPRLATTGRLCSSDLCLVSSAGQRLHCGATVWWSRTAE
ncbi:MAG: class I SAM-dependent methyltransferase [Pirellulales bacterium]